VELQRSSIDFEREGIAVFGISYDSVATLAAFAGKYGITYPLLSDEGSRVIRELGLLNEHIYEQHAVYGVKPQERHMGTPYPGVFLLDEQGVVTEKRFHQSYRERETGAGLLEDAFGAATTVHGTEVRAASEGVGVRVWLDSDSYRYFQRLYVTVELNVAEGLHVYGSPIPEGFIPLSVGVAPLEGVQAGTASMPPPHPFQVAGMDEHFFVYEGRVLVTLPVTFTKRDAGDLVLPINVRYQACSANDCLMPVSTSFELSVKAEALVPSATPER